MSVEDITKTGIKFEQHSGTLLRCSLTHEECVQTVDMPELCQHIGQVLGNLHGMIEAGTTQDYTSMQEVLVVSYLSGVGSRLDSGSIDEDRTMHLYCDHLVTRNFLKVLASPAAIYDKDCLIVASKALSAVVDSEHFQTHSDEHLPSPEDFAMVGAIQDKFLAELTKDAKFRISIRPLCDYIKKTKSKLK